MMWPYTEEEANYYNNEKTQETNQAPDWDYDTYGHGA
jgi:hypothetical protein